MILKFDQIKSNQLGLVGGKGLSLAKMAQANLPVPPGFVVTTQAFDEYATTKIESNIIDQLHSSFDELKTERVAVRSSAIAEDSSSASWAGQLETYLNVDKSGLIEAIQKCWQSINSERVQQYATRQDTDKDSLKVGVVVQAMVDSDVSGVMFTTNPLTGNPDQLMIEASFGLGEMIVQGEVTPDNYIVDTNGLITKTINAKDKMMVWQDGSNTIIDVPSDQINQQALADDKIKELAALGKKIEQFYSSPQDTEWCFKSNKLYIVQSRPITTLKAKQSTENIEVNEDKVLAKGFGASQGSTAGRVRLITSLAQLGEVQEGEILVTHKTTPDYVEAFSKVAGVVTESGGVTSHAAIVSRELGIPAVVGTVDITTKVKDGDIITVDGNAGYVYSGEVKTLAAPRLSFDMPQSTGDDITDMVNAIATGINDANELWPLGPAQLMSFIDADQSVDMLKKLRHLEEEGMSEDQAAQLFERPIFIKMFLLNTGIVGMKAANVYEKRASLEDQMDLVSRLLRLAKILNQNDDHYVVSRNYLWDQAQTTKFVAESEWIKADEQSIKVINQLSVDLLALNWAMYWDYFPEAGHELHGPYGVPKFGKNCRMVVKDYFNLATGEVWEHAKKFPYGEVRLAQVYDTDKMYINFGNRLVGDGLSKCTTHFILLVNGEPMTDIVQIQKMSAQLKQQADKQTKYVNDLDALEKVRKGARISYFTRKKFYQHFSQDWYPEVMVEGTIKALGQKFIDEHAETHPISLEEKKKMWDPRTDYLPS